MTTTYTLRVHDARFPEPVDTFRGLTKEELDHAASKAIGRGMLVDWARELISCPPDCDAGCYDAHNFAAARGELPANSYPSTAPVDALVRAAYAVVWGDPDELHEGLLQSLAEALDGLREGGAGPFAHSPLAEATAASVAAREASDDGTGPLLNTEEGDVCVTHGGTFEGDFAIETDDTDDPEPICSEVSGGFSNASELCRFVSADSTDDARINTPLDDDVTELRAFALRAIEPSGWGVPTYFADEGWTDARYRRAFEALRDAIDS